MNRKVAACNSSSDMEALAARRIPVPILDHICAGSGEERTVRENRTAFESYEIRTRVCRDVSALDMCEVRCAMMSS